MALNSGYLGYIRGLGGSRLSEFCFPCLGVYITCRIPMSGLGFRGLGSAVLSLAAACSLCLALSVHAQHRTTRSFVQASMCYPGRNSLCA